MNRIVKNKFFYDIVWVLLGNSSLIMVTFLQRLFIARFMGAEELGVYSLIMSIYVISTVIIAVGMPMAITKYVAEIKEFEQKFRELCSAGLLISAALGTLFACLFPIFSFKLSELLNIPRFSDTVIILAIIFPFSTTFYTFLAILNGQREMKTYSLLQVLQSILFLLISIFFLLFGFGLKSILLALWISITITTTILIIKKHMYFSFSKIPNLFYNAKLLLHFGVKVTLTNLVNEFNNYADFILLGFFLSPEKVGYYTVAISISRLIMIIPGCVQKITYPAASEYWAKNDNIHLNEMVNKTIKYSSVISIILGVGIGFFALEIITILFGEGYEAALIPMLILIFGVVLSSALVQSIGGLLSAIGRPELSLKADTITITINTILNILLIPQYGLLGAAIAKTFSLISNTIIKIFLFFKIAKLNLELKPFYLITVSAIPLIFIKWLFFITSLNSLASSFIVFLLYLFIFFKVYFYVYSEDIKFIKSLLS